MRRSRVVLFLTAVIVALSASPGHADAGDGVRIPGLRATASVVRDVDGVPHIKAPTPTTCSSSRAGYTPTTGCSRWT